MPWKEVLNFWFEEIEPIQHWKKDPEFDQMIRDRFSEIHAAATKCELFSWREQATIFNGFKVSRYEFV